MTIPNGLRGGPNTQGVVTKSCRVSKGYAQSSGQSKSYNYSVPDNKAKRIRQGQLLFESTTTGREQTPHCFTNLAAVSLTDPNDRAELRSKLKYVGPARTDIDWNINLPSNTEIGAVMLGAHPVTIIGPEEFAAGELMIHRIPEKDRIKGDQILAETVPARSFKDVAPECGAIFCTEEFINFAYELKVHSEVANSFINVGDKYPSKQKWETELKRVRGSAAQQVAEKKKVKEVCKGYLHRGKFHKPNEYFPTSLLEANLKQAVPLATAALSCCVGITQENGKAPDDIRTSIVTTPFNPLSTL